MDTRTLAVGQDVHVRSYNQYCEGKVVKVTPDGVKVQTYGVGLLRFDNDGKGCDGNDRFECVSTDTKTLVVGQQVSILCGYCVYEVEVVELTPEGGVVVRTIRPPADRFSAIGFSVGGLLRFDSNGKGYYITETSDCPGPWYIEKALPV